MNLEQQLKLQAWVDDELPSKEAQALAELAQRDKEVEAIVTELRLTKSMLSNNELERTLPGSVDFFWSRVRRDIERLDQAQPRRGTGTWFSGWKRFIAPASGLALIAFFTVLSLRLFHPGELEDSLKHLVEVESLSEHVGSISYKSQSENMFVVYLYNKESEAEPDTDSELFDEPVLQ